MTKISDLKQSTLLQLYARAAAPCRDYYGLTIGQSCISINAWKITHGPHCMPKQKFCQVEDVAQDKFIQEEIKNIFGSSVLEYIVDLANHKPKLENLPTKLFLRILKYLKINDVLNLQQTNKIFFEVFYTGVVELVNQRWCRACFLEIQETVCDSLRKSLHRFNIQRRADTVCSIFLCNTELVWHMMFQKVLNRLPSPEEKRMAFDCGWKEALKKRMAYIKKVFNENKLKNKKQQPTSNNKKTVKAK